MTFLMLPQVICQGCGHIPFAEPHPANQDLHLTKRRLVRCINSSCGQYKRLFSIPLHDLGAQEVFRNAESLETSGP